MNFNILNLEEKKEFLIFIIYFSIITLLFFMNIIVLYFLLQITLW